MPTLPTYAARRCWLLARGAPLELVDELGHTARAKKIRSRGSNLHHGPWPIRVLCALSHTHTVTRWRYMAARPCASGCARRDGHCAPPRNRSRVRRTHRAARARPRPRHYASPLPRLMEEGVADGENGSGQTTTLLSLTVLYQLKKPEPVYYLLISLVVWCCATPARISAFHHAHVRPQRTRVRNLFVTHRSHTGDCPGLGINFFF